VPSLVSQHENEFFLEVPDPDLADLREIRAEGARVRQVLGQLDLDLRRLGVCGPSG
jgi:hypothetical protein